MVKLRPLPQLNPAFVARQKYFFLFESGLPDKQNSHSYIFLNPLQVFEIYGSEDALLFLEKLEALSRNFYVVCSFTYELGYHFEPGVFKNSGASSYPLIQAAAFSKPIVFDHFAGKFSEPPPSGLFSSAKKTSGFILNKLRLNVSAEEYFKKAAQIKAELKQGNSYQVNFTMKFKFKLSGSALVLYQELKQKQPVPYSGFYKFDSKYLLSFSPELFFKLSRGKIICRPMKGTIQRGNSSLEDSRFAMELKKSSKDQAENLMIVDLIRNDLGRLCLPGSIATNKLFTVEKYNTLFQLTSGVSGRLRPGIGYTDIFAGLFPGGSVTGTPKLSTMKLIRRLEKEPRNIYCGALGFTSPGGQAVFNIPSRTILLQGMRGEMGIGSGITYASDPKKEFAECLLKAKFLTDASADFDLLETLRYENGYSFLKEHLTRLKTSAKYFNYPLELKLLRRQLRILKNKLSDKAAYKIRVLVNRFGKIKIATHALSSAKQNSGDYITISKKRMNTNNRLLYHKTTSRDIYNSEHTKYSKQGFADVVFQNQHGEITEGAISNIFILKNNKYFTPPVSAGLLPGVYRNYFLEKAKATVKTLKIKDLASADKIFITNSVRGLTEVVLKT